MFLLDLPSLTPIYILSIFLHHNPQNNLNMDIVILDTSLDIDNKIEDTEIQYIQNQS